VSDTYQVGVFPHSILVMFVSLGFGQNLYNWLESAILDSFFSFLLSNRYVCHELIQIAIVQLRLNFSNLIIIMHKTLKLKTINHLMKNLQCFLLKRIEE
jgi:hypothetical protein